MASPGSQKSTIGRSTRWLAQAVEWAMPAAGAALATRLWFTVPSVDAVRRNAAIPLGDPAGAPFTVDVGGCRVAGRTWGDGRAVYLVHGWGGWGTQLVGFVRPLVEAGFRVVTFDAPSHGESGPGSLGRRSTSLVELADALTAVADEHGPAAAVVAHSLGGTATGLALRDGLKADRIVLVAPVADPGPYLGRFVRGLGFGRRVLARARTRIERRAGIGLDALNLPRVAGEVATPPVLVVHDRDDREVDWSDGAAVAAAWPESVLVSTTGLGHSRILRDPVVVAEVVAFLTPR
jgi:pimeloyl-ACP methyl ester carboxylesterase